MKKLLLLLLVFSLSSQYIISDDKTTESKNSANQISKKQENIKKILDMTFDESILLPMREGLFNQFPEFSKNANTSKEITEELKKAAQKFFDTFLKEFSSDTTRKSLIAVYDKIYTDKDIAELLKFYESETGQKFIKSVPQLTTETAMITNSIVQKHLPNYLAELAKIQEKAKKTVESKE